MPIPICAFYNGITRYKKCNLFFTSLLVKLQKLFPIIKIDFNYNNLFFHLVKCNRLKIKEKINKQLHNWHITLQPPYSSTVIFVNRGMDLFNNRL